MKEDFLITIHGDMEQDGTSDSVELMTRGTLVHRGGSYYICYAETEATGYAGCTTRVKVHGDDFVSMTRTGPAPSQLIIEKGRRHLCHYETGQGALTLGIAADEISSDLTEDGGTVEFGYTLDVDTSTVSSNHVTITVRPAD